MPASDRSYLERHGSQWRVVVKVPPAARRVLGKAHLKQPLGTDSLTTANLHKMRYVDLFRRQIAAALGTTISASASLDNEASMLRAARRVQKLRPESYWPNPLTDEEPVVVLVDDTADAIEERAEQIERIHSVETAARFADASFGRSIPIDAYLDEFIADPDTAYVPKSVLDLRRAVGRLEAWLRETFQPATLQTLDRATAQEFLRWLRRRMAKKTHGKYRGFLTSYWGWMAEQEFVPDGADLWAVKTISRRRKTTLRPPPGALPRDEDGGKRPFAKPELVALLAGEPNRPYMADLIRIAALSGMRIEEIYGLRVQDCAGGAFNVRSGKTANAVRHVPVHSGLAPIIRRLTKGRPATAYLIDPAAPLVPKTGLRSGAATKAFTRYRRACGVDERPNQKAKSNVDFHSLRRWFITEAEAALGREASGYTAMTIADVVGHDTSGLTKALPMTLGVYRGKADDVARKACVEAVKLP